MISPETNFIGCFSDKTIITQRGMYKKNCRLNNNYSCSDSYLQFDKLAITQILESSGFKICDMTEIKGLTYFMTKTKVSSIK
jgi:hypothetical protein